MSKINNYLSLVKFAHTIFAIPFALVGFFLAIKNYQIHKPWYLLLLLVILCMLFARNAAMGFNRYIDRSFDSINVRTAQREIPSGIISPKKALVFVIINAFLFMFTTFFINQNHLTFFLSPIALIVILGYSFTKRFTSLCHLFLGLGLALAPIGAYISVSGKFDYVPVFLSFMVLFWVSGFDIIYAIQDIDFDKSQKLKSIPESIGIKNSLFLSAFFHLISLSIIIIIGFSGKFGYLYWIGSLIFIFLLIYQHLIVKVNNLTKINLAFFTTNGIASVIFGIFSILDIVLN
jgi:4-hydroxybenzoate polyprenyltransferase